MKHQFNIQISVASQDGETPEHDKDVILSEKPKVKRPPMYQVLLHNDDYTTMEFVVHILKKFFNKTHTEAEQLMLQIHNDGAAVCATYTFEVAEVKTLKVNRYARDHGHPLKCSFEPCH